MGRLFSIHEDYVNMDYRCVQGSYADINVARNATKLFLDLIARSYLAAMSDVEIFIGTSEPWQR